MCIRDSVGPEPLTTTPRAPASSATASVSASSGASSRVAGCRSLDRAAPRATGSPGPQGPDQLGVDVGLLRRQRTHHLVVGVVDACGGQPGGPQTEGPV